jgi:hypothetical protein
MPAGITRKTGIMIKILIHTTENSQRLLLSISYSCEFSHGIATYNGQVECSADPLAPFDPNTTAYCNFTFTRDAYWSEITQAKICNPHGLDKDALKDILIRVTTAIMEHEQSQN